MLQSSARVTTETPARYAKQLVSHLGRKAAVTELPDGAHQLRLSVGVGVVRIHGSALVLEASAVDELSLTAVEDVLRRHLARFGARQELEVIWSRADATGAGDQPPIGSGRPG